MKATLEEVWSKLANAVCNLQLKDGEHVGHVYNAVIDGVYLRETAFAAKVFQVAYDRTKNETYLKHHARAISALNRDCLSNCATLNEPFWTPRGIRTVAGSIPATVILWHALTKNHNVNPSELAGLENHISTFLKECYKGKGAFAHDRLSSYSSSKIPSVINTSAMAYAFITTDHGKLIQGVSEDEVREFIINSQRIDGLWPYISPGTVQKIVHRFFPRLAGIPRRIYELKMGDASVYFGDYLHHVVTLYYLVIGEERQTTLNEDSKATIRSALKFIIEQSVAEDGVRRLIFDWEPKITSYRHCNMFDVSTYFYLLSALSIIHKNNWFPELDLLRFRSEILQYVLENLVDTENGAIAPYDTNASGMAHIMPRPAESIFDKMFFLSCLLESENV